MKVLIVEDNVDLSASMVQYFARERYVYNTAFSCEEALDRLAAFDYDIAILDLMLPDGNGLDVLRVIKKEYPHIGILIISAKGSLDDRLNGLDLGADDYITKPFHLSEINARVKAIYRRRHFEGNNEIVFNEIRINPDTLEVMILDTPISLTRKEYELLVYFLANKDRLLTKQAIAEHLWGDHMDLQDSFDFVYQHIKNLRKKISAAGGTDYLATLYGMGYKFNTRVS
jgi:DNA-binding response OmpR family regulator